MGLIALSQNFESMARGSNTGFESIRVVRSPCDKQKSKKKMANLKNREGFFKTGASPPVLKRIPIHLAEESAINLSAGKKFAKTACHLMPSNNMMAEELY